MKDIESMNEKTPFSTDFLKLDCSQAVQEIAAVLKKNVLKTFRKRGLVLGLSGGIDSSVVAGLCVEALGKERVLGLLMPEKDSNEDTQPLGRLIADHLGITTIQEDITPILEAAGCYRRRDDAIRSIIPEYDSSYRCKIILPNLLADNQYRIFSVVVQSPQGEQIKKRLTPEAYLGIVAATNFKQRTRKMLEYYHADRLNYAVAGTPNRQEYDQGFFVKLGDGAADIKPIAHLYKTQVYQLAKYLGVPEEICRRPPTTDTYSLAQTQEEFFFSVPYDKMDLCLYGKNHSVPINDVAQASGLTSEQVERIFQDIDQKRKSTIYLHLPPLLIEEIDEITDIKLQTAL